NPDRVAAIDGRRRGTILVRVKEEQLVGAAWPSHGAPDRVAQRLCTGLHLGIAVFHVHPAVRIPVRVGLDVVGGTPDSVRAALGDRGDLQTAGAAVFGLVALGEDLHFSN